MFQRRAISVCAVITLVWPAVAAAQEWPPFSAERMGSNQYRQCLRIDPSEVQETNCLAQEYARRDRQLTNLFANYLKASDARERPQIMKAHAAWTRFRAENCRVRQLNPGSGMGSFYYGCLVRETNIRIAELTQRWDY